MTPPSGRCGKFSTPTHFDCRVDTTNSRKPAGRAEYLPLIRQVSPPAPRNPHLLEIDTPTLVQSMTALEAEEQQSDNDEWDI